MARVKLRYYVVKKGRGYWQTTAAMQAAGFPKSVPCGTDGPEAWAVAEKWNERWDRWRHGERREEAAISPPGSLGDAFDRYRQTEAWNGKAHKTRLEWERAWLDIKPVFGDIAPHTITLEHIDIWYSDLLENTTVDRAWRAMKIWRALWKIAAGLRYTGGHEDPSKGIRRQGQPKRSHRWHEGEVVRLVKAAWRQGHKGLACIIAVAWDSQLAPKDVRTLTPAQQSHFGFKTARAKTGKAALGTISKRTARLIEAYRDLVPGSPAEPMFKAQNGAPFDEFTMSKAFARVRGRVFPGDRRTLMDMRRSGAVEALAGKVDPGALAAKMANSINVASDLQATYLPVDPVVVRQADEARRRGREALRNSRK